MTPAARIIGKFGGIRPLARALEKTHSTVQRWAESGFIPPVHQADVLAASTREGLADPVVPEDFVPLPPDAEAA